jgi:ribosomal protein S18 acetylase RimI-like enzyme
MTLPEATTARRADLRRPAELAAVLELLDGYAADAMGRGRGLEPSVRLELPRLLAELPHASCLLLYAAEQAVGLAICFELASTFAAHRVLYLHDFYVRPSARGRGLGRALLEAVREEAARRGCTRLMLEVREDNARARQLYAAAGYHPQVPPMELWSLELDPPPDCAD